MRITLQCSYHHGKGEAGPGDVIDVDKAEAERLIGLGVASAPAAKQKLVDPPKTAATAAGGTPPPETGTGGGEVGNTGGTDDDTGTRE